MASLTYNISNWNQLAQCKSNTDVDLFITVKQLINSPKATGTVILINHNQFGTLFGCIIKCQGNIFVPDPNSGKIKEFTTDEILLELKKFGFEVTFSINQHLSGDQISYLMTLDGLDYNKLRVLPVKFPDNTISNYIVAFDSYECSKWLVQSYVCPEVEFLKALNDGFASNLTNLSKTKQFEWTWLTYVASIQDVIRDNQ